MAYLSEEFYNARLIWLAVASRVLVVGLVIMGLTTASALAVFMGYAPTELYGPR